MTAPEQADKVREAELDCGDNSCLFAKNKTGMRTNGGCRCFEDAGLHHTAIRSAIMMLPKYLTLTARVAEKDAEIAALKQEVAGGSWAYVKQIDDLTARLASLEGELEALEKGAREFLERRFALASENTTLRTQLAAARDALKLARDAIDALAATQKEEGLGMLGKIMAPDTLKIIDTTLSQLKQQVDK